MVLVGNEPAEGTLGVYIESKKGLFVYYHPVWGDKLTAAGLPSIADHAQDILEKHAPELVGSTFAVGPLRYIDGQHFRGTPYAGMVYAPQN